MRLDLFLLSPSLSDRLVDCGVDRWARAGKRQRPCANMEDARSLDSSCLNHEFIESKHLGSGPAVPPIGLQNAGLPVGAIPL
jgi:hypothetical protein